MAALAESVHQKPLLEQEDWEPTLSLRGLPLPLTLRSNVRMTDEALMDFSRRNCLYGIERNAEGDLEIMSPTGGDGSILENTVSAELFAWAKVNGGKAFNASAGFNLPDGSMRMPDAAWVSDARWAVLTKAERRGLPPICPDFIVEVLSINDSRRLLEEKMLKWIVNGTKLAWMVDPYKATVSIYRLGAAVEILDRPDFVEAGEPVSGFHLSTLLLWDE